QMKAVVFPLTSEIAIKAGKLKQELRKTSKNISLADAINFQTAKSLNAIFVTGDPDFKDVREDILFLEETAEDEKIE
ncbi:MAG: PIN domain-containing protein, partial [Patescibacteria group bacterium]